MTNEQLLEDLKQFVSTTVSQTEQRITEQVDKSIEASEARVIQHINSVQDAIAETLTTANEATDSRLQAQIDDIKVRLTRLETHSA